MSKKRRRKYISKTIIETKAKGNVWKFDGSPARPINKAAAMIFKGKSK